MSCQRAAQPRPVRLPQATLEPKPPAQTLYTEIFTGESNTIRQRVIPSVVAEHQPKGGGEHQPRGYRGHVRLAPNVLPYSNIAPQLPIGFPLCWLPMWQSRTSTLLRRAKRSGLGASTSRYLRRAGRRMQITTHKTNPGRSVNLQWQLRGPLPRLHAVTIGIHDRHRSSHSSVSSGAGSHSFHLQQTQLMIQIQDTKRHHLLNAFSRTSTIP